MGLRRRHIVAGNDIEPALDAAFPDNPTTRLPTQAVGDGKCTGAGTLDRGYRSRLGDEGVAAVGEFGV
jgi:hypothetical protein